MKLQLSYSGLGPRVFMARLASFLEKNYEDVTVVKENPNLYFSAVWMGKPPKKCKHIHRADGCYFDKLNFHMKGSNKRIGWALNAASAVVYQSKYSKKMCEGIIKIKAKKDIIIHNGFDSSVYNDIPVDKMGFEKMFVASAKWRPLKRPRSIARGFLAAKVTNSVLVMMGEISKKDRISDERIKYVGNLRPKDT